MTMTNNVPDWLTPIAWTFIAAAIVTAILIAIDIYGRGRRHDTVAAEVVWVTSALYLGPSRWRSTPGTDAAAPMPCRPPSTVFPAAARLPSHT